MAVAKKKKVTARRVSNKSLEPKWDDCEKLSGQEFGRRKHEALEFYRFEYKNSDFKKWILEYVDRDPDWKKHKKIIAKVPDNVISGTLGSVCRMRNNGMPDLHKPYAEYWDTLPGTMGSLKPISEFINTQLGDLVKRGESVVITEEKEKQAEQAQSEVYKPTIQDRIREASGQMVDLFEQAFDDFIEGKITDFKHIKATDHLRKVECKQPHARLIKTFYDPMIEEYQELLNPPDTKSMGEHEKEMHSQLKEGYAHYSKSQIKKLYEYCLTIQGACDAIIAESKANRKPRKMSKKSPEKIVEKMKYKISDEKYNVASIESHKIVASNCLVVFNSKTRKLGIYYTSVEDPTGVGREGSGLTVKGTTLQRFDEEKSVAKTLRKPVEQLQEVKNLNTRKKFENWFEKIKATPVKMNGRINPETILIGVY